MSQEQSLTDREKSEIFSLEALQVFQWQFLCVGFYFYEVADSVKGAIWLTLCLTDLSKFGNPRSWLGTSVCKSHFRCLDYQEHRDKPSLLHAFQCYCEKGKLAIAGNTKVLLEVKISRSWHFRLHWKSWGCLAWRRLRRSLTAAFQKVKGT